MPRQPNTQAGDFSAQRTKRPADRTQRIAVIGAGVAGLTAAHTLKNLGYPNVTIFEKEQEAGGKVKTIFHEGRAYELGAVWLTADYRTVLKLARELGVPKMAARSVNFVRCDGLELNTRQMLGEMGGLCKTLAAMISFLQTLRRFPEMNAVGFVGASTELHDTIADFSEKHKFLPFTRILAPLMTGCGYGFYQEVPALYWLKLMPMIHNIYLRGLIPFSQSLWSFPGGFQHLWTQLAATLPVRLGTEVTRIVRSPATGRITLTAGGGEHEFERMILTTPLHQSQDIMTLSAGEGALFAKINNLRYRITIAETNSAIHGGILDHISSDRINHVNFMGQFYEDSGVSVLYQMLDEAISDADAGEVLERDLARSGVRIGKVLAHKTWTYFPHARKADLDAGFYRRLDDLQGTLGTYYAGGLLNFETVEHTASHAAHLVRRFFG